ncbi:hypothetical protein [Saccharothrix syringae]|nr:hypothetical protein [Saccharothrix syringae]
MPLELLVVIISAGAGITASVINAVGRIVAARLGASKKATQAGLEE